MQRNLKSPLFRIRGMTCAHCQNLIEKTLKATSGIAQAAVDFNTQTARVTYDESVIRLSEIGEVIQELGYSVADDQDKRGRGGHSVTEIAGTLALIAALYMVLQALGLNTLTAAFPLAEAGMGYRMLFIIGLLTSVHCAAMCGGINLSQCLPAAAAAPRKESRLQVWLPSILYNSGRVISYTLIGALVGALGSVISLSGRLQGVIQLAAGIFMVIMGITMLGFFPGLRRLSPRLPRIFARKIDEQKTGNKHPLGIGLLNGLMPCGPLQAMQLYALSTASPWAGGLSMFLFSLGTVPLMFGIGALSSFLSRTAQGTALSRRVMQVGAVLVTVMGMTMVTYGFTLSGIRLDFAAPAFAVQRPPFSKTGESGSASGFAPVIEQGFQIVNSTLRGGRYPAITVQQGIPVKWTIDAPAGSINGCNNRMIIREYGIEHRFKPGENLIEFTPTKTGKFSYSCWMGMIRSSITVLAEGEAEAAAAEPDTAPSPAGVAIPVEEAALAEIQEDHQSVRIRLTDEGIEPALVVVQRSLPVLWTVTKDSLDPGNSRLIFPAYETGLEMEAGDNLIRLMPTKDFDFSTADQVFYGYVKVVDDLRQADLAAIKAEVAGFETLRYPDAYFAAAAQGGSCCAP